MMRMIVATLIVLAFVAAPVFAQQGWDVQRDRQMFKSETVIRPGLNDDAALKLQPDDNRDSDEAWTVEVEAADGDYVLNSTVGEALKVTTNGNVTALGTLAWTPSAAQAGAKNGSAVTASIANPKPFAITLTIDDLSVPIINGNGGAGTNWTGGVKIHDFPEGLLDIEAVLVSDVILVATGGVAAAEGGDWALGTTIEAGDTLATATAVDLCPATSHDPWSGTNSAFLAAGVLFDGTATAKDVYFNMSVDSGDISGATTVMVDSATITLTGKMCGDD